MKNYCLKSGQAHTGIGLKNLAVGFQILNLGTVLYATIFLKRPNRVMVFAILNFAAILDTRNGTEKKPPKRDSALVVRYEETAGIERLFPVSVSERRPQERQCKKHEHILCRHDVLCW